MGSHAKANGGDKKETVAEFKAGTRSYGQGELNADTFVQKLVTLLNGDGTFTGSIVPQLAQLIADDQKRSNLIPHIHLLLIVHIFRPTKANHFESMTVALSAFPPGCHS